MLSGQARRRQPPSKPKKVLRKDRGWFYAQYWEDELDSTGKVLGRKPVQVPIYDDHGERISTPKKADQACDDLYQQLLAVHHNVINGAVRISEYKGKYITGHLGREGTSRTYDTKLRDFISFLDTNGAVTRFSELRREHIKAYLDHRLSKVKIVTVHGDLRALRAFFNEAIKDRHITENPCRGIKLPRLAGAKASEGFFLPEEMDAIIAYCLEREPEWYAIFAGFRYAPFRREELCFLEWEDLEFGREVIYVRDEKRKYNWRPKRDGRTMDLHPKLMEVLQGIEPEGSFVFPAPEAWDVDSVVTERKELGRRAWRKIKTICRALDLKAKDKTGSWDRRFPNGPHLKAFRSGVCVELQLNGAPLSYCQAQLGHHSLDITLDHYTHMVPELLGHLTKKFIKLLGSG